MIFEILRGSLTLEGHELLSEALKNRAILAEKRVSLIPLYGVTSAEIEMVEASLRIHRLEGKLSPNKPYCNSMPEITTIEAFGSNWLKLSGIINPADESV